MCYLRRDRGFTLIEVLAVIIIIAGLSAIAIPKIISSIGNARQKADIATAHQIKAALDRYQVENGIYLKTTELTVNDEGEVICQSFIPKYISKLDKTTTQQAAEGKEGFGVASLTADDLDETLYVIPDLAEVPPTNLIMIYLTSNGYAAEVRAYDATLEKVLWTSAN